VKVLSVASLRSRILNGDPNVVWVVLFRASWSGHCDNFDPIFSDLSLKCVGSRRWWWGLLFFGAPCSLWHGLQVLNEDAKVC